MTWKDILKNDTEKFGYPAGYDMPEEVRARHNIKSKKDTQKDLKEIYKKNQGMAYERVLEFPKHKSKLPEDMSRKLKAMVYDLKDKGEEYPPKDTDDFIKEFIKPYDELVARFYKEKKESLFRPLAGRPTNRRGFMPMKD